MESLYTDDLLDNDSGPKITWIYETVVGLRLRKKPKGYSKEDSEA
jgi:hypothetical protein